MQVSKIQFSREELNLAGNAEWILTKNGIIAKVMSLFGELADEYRSIVEKQIKWLPEQTAMYAPKISRGEQYCGLPYVILDYPRIFSKEDVFAVRTMFWWGNYFSLTLHLKGEYKNAMQDTIARQVDFFSANEFLIAISENEWQHDVSGEEYVSVRGSEILVQERVVENKFVKLTRTWSLEQANQLSGLLANEFSKLLKVITT